MARKRMIDPRFFDSDSLAECSIPTRLAFMALLVYVNDYGNEKLSIKRMCAHAFEDEDCITDWDYLAMLAKLEEVGCIKFYAVDGDQYITVSNFETYQKVQHPSDSTVPKPSEYVRKRRKTRALEAVYGMDGTALESFAKDSGIIHPNKLVRELTNTESVGGADAPTASSDFDAASYAVDFRRKA